MRGIDANASSSALMIDVMRAASFSDMGAMGVSPRLRCSTERWMIFTVGKNEAAPAMARSVNFSQKIGLRQ